MSRIRRPLVALGSVVLVITPISWILLHEPQSDTADASVPYTERTDDTYITPSNQPVSATPTPRPTKPGPTTAKPTRTPSPGDSETPTPTTTPSGGPSTEPTDGPTDQPTDEPTDQPSGRPTTQPTEPGRTGETRKPQPTRTTTTSKPTTTPTSTPPADDGNMDSAELSLFKMIDSARQDKGCAPLGRDSGLSGGADDEAAERADSGDVSDTSSSGASTGGKNMSASAAFDKLMDDSSSTLLNCGLDELGVGSGDATDCALIVFGCYTRVAWVVDFN